MTKSMSEVKAPFQNLKFFVIMNKAMGLISCKLVNGRFKQSSVYGRCLCILWFLFHCAYSSVYYYTSFIASPDIKAQKGFALSIVRFSLYFVSLLPYNCVAAFWVQDFVKFSDKLETYDDKAAMLGHPRKDKNVFTWLYFMYTSVTIIMRVYYAINDSVTRGTIAVIETVCEIAIPIVTGTYCVFVTCMFLDLIRQRFHHLNETIVPQVSQLPVTGTKGEITVYDVRYLHGVLIDSAELINTLYGIGTLLIFGSALLEFISIIYIFLTDVQEHATVTILDLFFQTIYLFSMYHITSYEANRVEERVIKYGLPFQNEKCHMEKIEMMLYFYHKRFSFTAAGFFVLDLTILFPIATTVTTYITLIV